MSAQPWTVEEAGLGAAGDFKNFWFLEGVILDQSSSSETSVYRDSLGSISSKTYVSQDIWIKTETHGEVRIRLNKAIPLRPGQEAVIVNYRKHIEKSESCFVYIKNTKELHEISYKPFSYTFWKSAIPVLIGLAITFGILCLEAIFTKGKGGTLTMIAFFISIFGIPIVTGAERHGKYNRFKNNFVYNYLSSGGDLTVNQPVKDEL